MSEQRESLSQRLEQLEADFVASRESILRIAIAGHRISDCCTPVATRPIHRTYLDRSAPAPIEADERHEASHRWQVALGGVFVTLFWMGLLLATWQWMR